MLRDKCPKEFIPTLIKDNFVCFLNKNYLRRIHSHG